MGLDQVILLVKDVGFPIAVAAYVLIRLDHRLGELIREVKTLHARVGTLLGHLDARPR